MKHIMIVVLLGMTLFACDTQENLSEVQLYEGPNTLNTSDLMDVFVNDEPVFVYETRVNHDHFWSWNTPETTAPVVIFDFNGTVEINIHLPYEPQVTTVKPLAKSIEVQRHSNVVTFRLDEPGNYVIEFDHDEKKVLHVFTQKIDDN